MLCYSKLIGLRAKLQDAAGAVRSHNLYNFHKYFLYIIICRKRSRWKNVSLLEIPIRRQDYTSLCRAQGKTACSFDNATFRVVLFVLGHVISVSTYQFFRSCFFSRCILQKLSWQGRWLIKKVSTIWAKVFLTTTIRRYIVVLCLVWKNSVPDYWLPFRPNFLSAFVKKWLLLVKSTKVCDKSKTWVGFLPSSAVCI